jgi:predicted HicB family RNase H-like nuclease
MKKQYYLIRFAPSAGENLGPFADHATAKAKQAELNAEIIAPPRRGRGRPAKKAVRFELRLQEGIHNRLTAHAAQTGELLTTVVERALDAALPK